MQTSDSAPAPAVQASGFVKFVYDDGGRAAAGYRGKAGDCVCRAIAIATGKPYREIYGELTEIGWLDRPYVFDADGLIRPHSATTETLRAYMAGIGWLWT